MAHSATKTGFFESLPAELRLEILLQLRSRSSMLNLIEASPVMLQGCLMYKSHIRRTLVASDLDDSMVQDAMCLLLFPPENNMTGIWSQEDKDRSHSRMMAWQAQRLPNPLLEHDEKLLQGLVRIHDRLMFLIEDYLAKSTAVFPPRAYLCLFDWSTRHYLTWQGKIVARRFDSASLNSSERRRLLQAFLRYELISKSPWSRGSPGDEVLHQYSGHPFRPAEQEAIDCVGTYIESLYAALFAHLSASWLPHVPGSSSTPKARELPYPDNFYVDADVYAHNLDPSGCFCLYMKGQVSEGFDYIANLIKFWAVSDQEGQNRLRDHMWGWIYGLGASCGLRHNAQPANSGRPERNGDFDREGPGLYQSLYPRLSEFTRLQREIYRQRAWAFLDDDRLFPTNSPLPVFPTRRQLRAEFQKNSNAEGTYDGPIQTRPLRRSKRWQAERRKDAGRTQLDYHGFPRPKHIDSDEETAPDEAGNSPRPHLVSYRMGHPPKKALPFWIWE